MDRSHRGRSQKGRTIQRDVKRCKVVDKDYGRQKGASAPFLLDVCPAMPPKYRGFPCFVWKLARKMHRRLSTIVDFDELMQVGFIAFLQAEKRHDPNGGASLRTFAGIRVRGAMLDVARQYGYVPKSMAKDFKRVPMDTVPESSLEPDYERMVDTLRLRELIDSLPPDESALLKRHYANGESLKVIANSRGVTESAVWQKFRRVEEKIVTAVLQSCE